MQDRDPLQRVTAQIPFTIAAVILCAVLGGLIMMLPVTKALGIVLLVLLGAAAYTAVEYKLPDLDGNDPHDRAWIVSHMTRNTVAVAIIIMILMGLRHAGAPKEVVNLLAPILVLILGYGWYRWKGSI